MDHSFHTLQLHSTGTADEARLVETETRPAAMNTWFLHGKLIGFDTFERQKMSSYMCSRCSTALGSFSAKAVASSTGEPEGPSGFKTKKGQLPNLLFKKNTTGWYGILRYRHIWYHSSSNQKWCWLCFRQDPHCNCNGSCNGATYGATFGATGHPGPMKRTPAPSLALPGVPSKPLYST